MDLLTAAAREQGTTVVLVTHEPRVAAYADREVIVRDGKVDSLTAGRVGVMIRLGLRLDRRAAAGRRSSGWSSSPPPSALGVGLLLTTLAGINAVNAQNAAVRLAEHRHVRPAPPPRHQPGGSADPLWWLLRRPTTSTARPIGRVDVAATGPARRSRRASRACPGPGQFYASPALRAAARPPRPTSSATASPGTWSARSAPPRCRPRTRWSSSSATPRPQLAAMPGAPARSPASSATVAQHCRPTGCRHRHRRRRHRPRSCRSWPARCCSRC